MQERVVWFRIFHTCHLVEAGMVAKSSRENVQEIEEIRKQIRKAGVRATPARIAALQLLRAATAPLTHADLSDRLVPLGFDKATVFRNLSDLTEVGLVSRTELGDHVWRFEAVDPEHPEKSSHPHFVCTECGRVECLDAMEFTALSKRKATSIGRISEILLKGECTNCVSSASP
jgi:Fur family ferric uptake transcriptional regulator